MKRISILAVLMFFFISSSLLLSQESGEESLYLLAQDFVSLLAQNNFAKASENFDQRMAQALPVSQLESVWNQLLSSFGDFQSTSRKEFMEKEGYHVVILTLEFDKAFMDAEVTFDQQNKIAGFWINPPISKVEYRAPAYVKEELFTEEEIQIGEDPWKLPGTLSIPKGQEKCRGIVLVHG
jgi:hypothetical protein